MLIQKAELAQYINRLKSIVPKKTSFSVLQGILVRDSFLTASNMELTVKVRIKNDEKEEFLIPAKAFDLIGSLPDGEVNITLQKSGHILIRTGKIKNKCQTMDSTLFPDVGLPDAEGSEVTIDSEALLNSIRHVFYAISAQGNNQPMDFLYLEASNGTLNFVGLDGHVLAWDKIAYEGEFKLLIPRSTVEKLMSAGMKGEVRIRHNKSNAAFITQDCEIYTRIAGLEYYKYASMFAELPLHTAASKEEFLDAVIRARTCADVSPIQLAITGKEMNINVRNSTTDYHEVIALQEDVDENVTIGFNAGLIINTLKAFDGKNVKIHLADAKKPMIMEAEECGFKALVLPIFQRG